MAVRYIAAVALVVLSLNAVLGADFTVNLQTGQYQQNPSVQGISWVTRPTTPTRNLGTSACRMQGVLKLTFDKVNRKRAEFKLTFNKPTGFSFNIGDSSTNNGYGGDAATQDSDAEVHGLNQDILFYGKGIPNQYAKWYGHLYTAKNMLQDDNVTINVQDQLVVAETVSRFVYIDSHKVFNLNGQYDSEGPVNYDVYFAMNRVISGSYRSGTGLCRAEITWHSDKL